MVDTLDKEIDVDEIMRKIREELKRRKKLPEQETFQEKDPSPPQPPFAHPSVHPNPPAHQPPQSRVDINVLPYYINYHGFLEQAKGKEGLKGLLKYHLFKFIRFFAWWQEQINRALYQELMAQKARMEDKERWIQELHHQQMNRFLEELSERDKKVEDLNSNFFVISQAKEELSRRLSDQEVKIVEAEKRIKGLLKQQSLRLIQELSERDKAIDRLNHQLIQLGQIEELFSREMIQQKEKLDAIERETKMLYHQGMDHLRSEFNKSVKELDQSMESIKQEFSHLIEFKSSINQVREELKDQKPEILGQRVRLASLLEETREQFKGLLKEENELPEEVYVAFENRFRGAREEIKERLKVYLPYVRQAPLGDNHFILDLGCGRGEWLELIKGYGYHGRGVDINRAMVRQCRELGLDVVESDMIDYLKKQDPDSFSMVTGFHILEHLSIGKIISLLDEVLRVLRPGGAAIFETPNPENLLVATCHFYLDPTHRHSLPSELVSFLLESRGFKKIEIVRRHAASFVQTDPEASPSLESLISLFNRERDYSVIAYKG